MTTIYVDQDGQYNWHNELITFEKDDFTEKQWELFTDLEGPLRFQYASAILYEDVEEIARLEYEYGYDTEEGDN